MMIVCANNAHGIVTLKHVADYDLVPTWFLMQGKFS